MQPDTTPPSNAQQKTNAYGPGALDLTIQNSSAAL